MVISLNHVLTDGGANPANNMISLESSESVAEPAEPESWMRILTVHGEEKMDQKAGAKLSGPTFMVNLMVEGVKTQALLVRQWFSDDLG